MDGGGGVCARLRSGGEKKETGREREGGMTSRLIDEGEFSSLSLCGSSAEQTGGAIGS